jgi:hypothetical protein
MRYLLSEFGPGLGLPVTAISEAPLTDPSTRYVDSDAAGTEGQQQNVDVLPTAAVNDTITITSAYDGDEKEEDMMSPLPPLKLGMLTLLPPSSPIHISLARAVQEADAVMASLSPNTERALMNMAGLNIDMDMDLGMMGIGEDGARSCYDEDGEDNEEEISFVFEGAEVLAGPLSDTAEREHIPATETAHITSPAPSLRSSGASSVGFWSAFHRDLDEIKDLEKKWTNPSDADASASAAAVTSIISASLDKLKEVEKHWVHNATESATTDENIILDASDATAPQPIQCEERREENDYDDDDDPEAERSSFLGDWETLVYQKPDLRSLNPSSIRAEQEVQEGQSSGFVEAKEQEQELAEEEKVPCDVQCQTEENEEVEEEVEAEAAAASAAVVGAVDPVSEPVGIRATLSAAAAQPILREERHAWLLRWVAQCKENEREQTQSAPAPPADAAAPSLLSLSSSPAPSLSPASTSPEQLTLTHTTPAPEREGRAEGARSAGALVARLLEEARSRATVDSLSDYGDNSNNINAKGAVDDSVSQLESPAVVEGGCEEQNAVESGSSSSSPFDFSGYFESPTYRKYKAGDSGSDRALAVLSLRPPSPHVHGDACEEGRCNSCRGNLPNLGCRTCTPRAKEASRQQHVHAGAGSNVTPCGELFFLSPETSVAESEATHEQAPIIIPAPAPAMVASVAPVPVSVPISLLVPESEPAPVEAHLPHHLQSTEASRHHQQDPATMRLAHDAIVHEEAARTAHHHQQQQQQHHHHHHLHESDVQSVSGIESLLSDNHTLLSSVAGHSHSHSSQHPYQHQHHHGLKPRRHARLIGLGGAKRKTRASPPAQKVEQPSTASAAATASVDESHEEDGEPSFAGSMETASKPLVYFKCGSALHFGLGGTPCGHTSRIKVALCNRGYRELTVTVTAPALPFVLLHKRIQLKPRSYVNLPVRYSPLTSGTHEGELVVCIEDREGQTTTGAGVEIARLRLLGCAAAGVRVKEKHE